MGQRRHKKTPEEWLEDRKERWALAFQLVEEDKATPRTKECVELVERGLGIPQIQERLSLGHAAVHAALDDPLRVKADARRRKTFGVCVDCGTRTFNGGAKKVPKRCASCDPKHKRKIGRARVIACMKLWNGLYGSPPTSTDWNLSLARTTPIRPERLEQIEKAHADHRWPSVAGVQGLFGTWNAAIRAAGFEPIAAGGGRRQR